MRIDGTKRRRVQVFAATHWCSSAALRRFCIACCGHRMFPLTKVSFLSLKSIEKAPYERNRLNAISEIKDCMLLYHFVGALTANNGPLEQSLAMGMFPKFIQTRLTPRGWCTCAHQSIIFSQNHKHVDSRKCRLFHGIFREIVRITHRLQLEIT